MLCHVEWECYFLWWSEELNHVFILCDSFLLILSNITSYYPHSVLMLSTDIHIRKSAHTYSYIWFISAASGMWKQESIKQEAQVKSLQSVASHCYSHLGYRSDSAALVYCMCRTFLHTLYLRMHRFSLQLHTDEYIERPSDLQAILEYKSENSTLMLVSYFIWLA